MTSGSAAVLPAAGPRRAAFVVLVLAAPVAFWAARDQWFFLDEWDFLAGRALGDPASLLRSHNGHWTTLPIVAYRAIFQAVGIRHYWPYLIPVVVAHLAVIAEVRLLALRAGAHPWAAVGAMTSMAFLGSGRQNFTWGFQVTFTGALAFGLAHLLVADHDGPTDRRDAAGVLLAILALACSALGVITAGITALAVLLRRGWRAASVHALVPATVLVVWAVPFRTADTSAPGSRADQLAFALWSYVDSLSGIGGSLLVGIALAVLVALGVSGGRIPTRDSLAHGGAVLVALLAGSLAFVAMTATSRAGLYNDRGTIPSRYVYVVAALLLPVAATGATILARRVSSKVLRAGIVGLLVVGLPANIARLEASGSEVYLLGSPAMVGELVAAIEAVGPPPDAEPSPDFLPTVTNGWLLEQVEGGLRLPAPPPADQTPWAAELAVSMARVDDPPELAGCVPLPPGRRVTLAVGEFLRVEGSSAVLLDRAGGTAVLQDPTSGGGSVWRVVAPADAALSSTLPADSAVQRCRA